MNAALLLSLALSLALPVLVMARLASMWSHDWVDEPERPGGRQDGLGLLTDGIFSPCLRADLSSFGFGLASDEKLLVIGICLNWHTLVPVGPPGCGGPDLGHYTGWCYQRHGRMHQKQSSRGSMCRTPTRDGRLSASSGADLA